MTPSTRCSVDSLTPQLYDVALAEKGVKSSSLVNVGEDQKNDEPYSIYSKPYRIVIAAIAAFAGLLSPLSSSTYFPALTVIQQVR